MPKLTKQEKHKKRVANRAKLHAKQQKPKSKAFVEAYQHQPGMAFRLGNLNVQEYQMEWISVESSNIKRIAYNPPNREMFIEFSSGDTYKYARVSRKRFEGLRNADSKGKYFHSKIKGQYNFTKES